MRITGKALKIERKRTISPCGFDGLSGYKVTDGKYGSDAMLSFMPKTHKVEATISTLEVEGRAAVVTKHLMSKHVTGMWTFYIKYED